MKSNDYKKIIDESLNNCANPHIGTIIKRRRHTLNMTLDETSKGICCISYLSKIEHGTIVPKKYILNEVLERLEIKEENLRSKKEYVSLINECLMCYYYKKKNTIIEIFESISDVENIHYTDIIKAIYYFTKNNLEKSEKFLNNALIVKKDLEQEELYACIILTSLLLEKKSKYKEALEILKTIEHIYVGNVEIEKLKLSLIARIYIVLGKYLSLANILIRYEDLCLKTVDFDGVLFVKKHLCMSLALSKDEEGALDLYDTISKTMNDNSKSFLKQIYIYLRKPNELLKIDNLTDLEKLWAYNLLKEKNECIAILDKIKVLEIKNEKDRLFVESMMKRYYENEYFYIIYLKEIYYPYLLEHGFYEEAKNIKSILFDYLILEAKYKDAVKVERDFNKMF